jgi:hypothetical protein
MHHEPPVQGFYAGEDDRHEMRVAILHSIVGKEKIVQ